MFLLKHKARERRSPVDRTRLSRLLVCIAGAATWGCTDPPPRGVSAVMNLDGAFFEAPFPSAHRDRGDGTLAVADFPTHDNAALAQLVELLESGTSGFGPSGAVFVPFDGAVDTSRLPATPEASLEPDASVFLVNVDPDSEAYGERIPIEVSFKAAAETYTPPNLLVVLPFAGVVLEPNTLHAVIVRRGLGDTEGRALFRAPLLDELLTDDPIAGPHAEALTGAFAVMNAWRGDAGGPYLDDIAAATVWKTGDPLSEHHRWHKQLRAQPVEPSTDHALVDTHDGLCVVRATVRLPIFQQGAKPYAKYPSGHLVVDDDGLLVEQARDEVELMLSIPHAEMPSAGFPLVLYAAGREGTAREVIDRTKLAEDPDRGGSGPRGQGPARQLAARGVAALGFPAPLAWERHPDGDGGGSDVENVENLATYRDVIRQGILDFATLVPLVESLELDAALCVEATSPDGTFRFDDEHLFLFGHSTGSTLAGAVIALEPDVRATILSGIGGSFIYDVALDRGGLDRTLLGYSEGDELDRFDPALTLFQTALSSVEVMSWGRATALHPLPGLLPKQVLMIQGVVDSFRPPRMANAYAMSVGLDLVEPMEEPTAASEYPLVGRGVIPAPGRANLLVGGGLTAVSVQHAQNEQDGHFVVFELDEVKHRYGCFIASLVQDGIATVPPPVRDPFAPCP